MRAPSRTIVVRLALLLALLCGGWGIWWWHAAHWRPDAARWPVQGIAVSADNAPLDWPTLARGGARFAYIEATVGTRANPRYEEVAAAARAAGLRVGALHHYSLCALATDQAAAFVRLVARGDAALPAAVVLDRADSCHQQPTEALMLTELATFLNQIDTHSGKRSLIAPTARFTADYASIDKLGHPLWLIATRTEPAPDAPPHMVWQANDRLRIDGATGPVRWLVLNARDEEEESTNDQR